MLPFQFTKNLNYFLDYKILFSSWGLCVISAFSESIFLHWNLDRIGQELPASPNVALKFSIIQ